MIFPTDIRSIENRIRNIQPVLYAKTRNFIDGDVTYLSPYISRGVISTKQVLEKTLERGFNPKEIEKFIQELAWRDYWQQVWVDKGNAINEDLLQKQKPINSFSTPAVILSGTTGIDAIDVAIRSLYNTGYLHNHLRMYIAMLTCNIAKCHWKNPAKWMYYYLLDGDWASNSLSWQWVAGSNSKKKYIANQENINKYTGSKQKESFLDREYNDLNYMTTPTHLTLYTNFELKTKLPASSNVTIDKSLPTLIYNYYNLDPHWREDESVNRILLLEPSIFHDYPVSQKCMTFALSLAKNINGIQIFVGEFYELTTLTGSQDVIYKEHPLNKHYNGTADKRDSIFELQGYYPSFFKYWNKGKKELLKYSIDKKLE